MEELPKFLTPAEFIEALERTTGRTISRSAVYRSMSNGRLHAARIGGRLLIDRQLFEQASTLTLKPRPDEGQQP